MMTMRELFFEDLRESLDYWVSKGAEKLAENSLGDSRKTREAAIRPVLEGLTHSFLVILDGGTKLAETERIHLVDSKGKSLGEGLHELFVPRTRKSQSAK